VEYCVCLKPFQWFGFDWHPFYHIYMSIKLVLLFLPMLISHISFTGLILCVLELLCVVSMQELFVYFKYCIRREFNQLWNIIAWTETMERVWDLKECHSVPLSLLQLLEVLNPFEPKLKCPVYTADGQDLNGNSLLCMFMADYFSAWSVFSPSFCIICSWMRCQRVNTGWGSVVWVVWYGVLQQLCHLLKGAQSSVQKIVCISPIIVLFSHLSSKNGEEPMSDSQDICECRLGWIMFWYFTANIQIWSRVWKILLTDCACRIIHTSGLLLLR
jgi:hypothetical protein